MVGHPLEVSDAVIDQRQQVRLRRREVHAHDLDQIGVQLVLVLIHPALNLVDLCRLLIAVGKRKGGGQAHRLLGIVCHLIRRLLALLQGK